MIKKKEKETEAYFHLRHDLIQLSFWQVSELGSEAIASCHLLLLLRMLRSHSFRPFYLSLAGLLTNVLVSQNL